MKMIEEENVIVFGLLGLYLHEDVVLAAEPRALLDEGAMVLFILCIATISRKDLA